jgi:tRNA U34 5-carboxymethylaminomethyl modifying enzyme MnmG/GidA
MQTLIEISRDLIELENELEEMIHDPQQTDDAIAKYLECFKDTIAERNQKLDNYSALIKELEARAEARKVEAKRLSDRASVDLNKVKSLKANLQRFFEYHEVRTIETNRYRLSLAKNGGKAPLILDNVTPSELPDKFTYKEVDKVAVREALESGEVLDFARLGERGQSLRIK